MTASLDFALAAWAESCARGLPFPFRGSGYSMWPLLRPGDVAWFTPLASGPPPRRGDVLLYRGPASLVAHRLLGEHRDGTLRLRGDFCDVDDPPVPRSALLGRLARVERAGPSALLLHGPAALRLAAIAYPLVHDRAPAIVSSLRRATRLASAAKRRLGSGRRQP